MVNATGRQVRGKSRANPDGRAPAGGKGCGHGYGTDHPDRGARHFRRAGGLPDAGTEAGLFRL